VQCNYNVSTKDTIASPIPFRSQNTTSLYSPPKPSSDPIQGLSSSITKLHTSSSSNPSIAKSLVLYTHDPTRPIRTARYPLSQRGSWMHWGWWLISTNSPGCFILQHFIKQLDDSVVHHLPAPSGRLTTRRLVRLSACRSRRYVVGLCCSLTMWERADY